MPVKVIEHVRGMVSSFGCDSFRSRTLRGKRSLREAFFPRALNVKMQECVPCRRKYKFRAALENHTDFVEKKGNRFIVSYGSYCEVHKNLTQPSIFPAPDPGNGSLIFLWEYVCGNENVDVSHRKETVWHRKGKTGTWTGGSRVNDLSNAQMLRRKLSPQFKQKNLRL